MILAIIIIVAAVLWAMNDRQAEQVREDLPPVVATVDRAASGGCGLVFWLLLALVGGTLLLGESTMIALIQGGYQVAGGVP